MLLMCDHRREGNQSGIGLCQVVYLRVSKVQNLIKQLVDEHKVALDALLTELSPKIVLEQCNNLHGKVQAMTAITLTCADKRSHACARRTAEHRLVPSEGQTAATEESTTDIPES